MSAVGPYTPSVRAGGWLVCSGQLGMEGGKVVEGGIAAQVTRAVANIDALLREEGASLTNVVKTTVFLADIRDYSTMNEAYMAAFGNHRPARSAFAVAALPLGAAVEIEAWAWIGQNSAMGGAIAIAVILVIVLPVLFLIGGTIGAVLIGWLLNANGQVSHEGSELIETNY